jgi:hypothetical protein
MLFNYNTIVTDLHIVIFLKIFYLNLGIVRKENAKNNPNNVLAKELIESYVKNGLKPIDMLKRIQKAGVKTSRGLEFKQVGQITRLIKELKKETK